MLFQVPLESVIGFTLVFFRMAGLLMTMPVVGGRGMPVRARVMLALAITLLLKPVLPPVEAAGAISNFWPLLGLVIQESLLGAMLGFIAQIPIWAAQLAGQLAGLQMGLGIASVLDPESGNQESLPASFLRNCTLVFFLMIGGHHVLIETLVGSFQHIPAGAFSLNRDLFDQAVELSTWMFTLGIRLGAPMLAGLLLAEAGLGLIARTVPQMNIFIVGFPMKIALGMILIAVTLPAFFILFEEQFANLTQQLEAMVGLAGP